MLLVALGAGETELKPTRSLRLLPCEGATGVGAANCVFEGLLVASGSGIPGMEALEALVLVGVAD